LDLQGNYPKPRRAWGQCVCDCYAISGNYVTFVEFVRTWKKIFKFHERSEQPSRL